MLLEQPYGSLPDFSWVSLRRISHGSILSSDGASGKPGAIQDVEYADFLKDGTTLHRTGKFMAGWIMDGRAVQDLWIVDPWGKHKEREVYTDVDYFDAKSRAWHAIFVDPQDGSVDRFTASEVENNCLVLETKDLGSGETRWSFNDIRPDSFVWRDEGSSDGGKTWKLRSEYHMRRL